MYVLECNVYKTYVTFKSKLNLYGFIKYSTFTSTSLVTIYRYRVHKKKENQIIFLLSLQE